MNGVYFYKTYTATQLMAATFCFVSLYSCAIKKTWKTGTGNKKNVKRNADLYSLHHLNRYIVHKTTVGRPLISDVGPLLVQCWYDNG